VNWAAVAWRTTPGIKSKRRQKVKWTMDMRQYTGESFVKLDDVRDGPLTETISGVVPGKYEKPNLQFESGSALSLNATNNKTLIRAYGPNSSDWIGKEVELFAGQVEFQGRPLDAVLVRSISPPLKASERTKLQAQPEFGGDLDESSKPTKRKGPPRKSGASFDDEIPY
jgi:hypothetical protein